MRMPLSALLFVTGCACAAPRALDDTVSATADLGDGIAIALDDAHVMLVPDDAAAPMRRLGALPGAGITAITGTRAFVLTTSSSATGDPQVHAFARATGDVRGIAGGWVTACTRGDVPIVLQTREDGGIFARSFDPSSLEPMQELLLDIDPLATLEGCSGDDHGLVLQRQRVVFDADVPPSLVALDTLESPARDVRLPGSMIAWRLGAGRLFALAHDAHRGGSGHAIAGLWRLDRNGGAPVLIQRELEHAAHLAVGERYACVSDEPEGRVRRVALEGGAAETLLEGVRAECLAVRGDSVVVLSEGRELLVLPD